MTLTNSEVDALKSSLDCWFTVEYVSTFIVLLGVVGEYVADFTRFVEERELTKPLGKISTLVLIVGLAGELISLGKTSAISGQITASLEERAAEAELQLAKLQERQRPRSVGKEFAEALRGKPKAPVKIVYAPNDEEAFHFASLVFRWLGKDDGGAGWEVSKPEPIPLEEGNERLRNAPPAIRYGSLATDIGIVVGQEELDALKNDPFNEEATSLGALKGAFRVSGYLPQVTAPENTPSDPMTIVIGQKP